MTYTTAEARQQLLDDLAVAVDCLAAALAAAGAAYELLDERAADRLEDELFRPLQTAYGRAQRAHGAFARRYGLPGRSFQRASAGGPGHDAKSLLHSAADGVDAADSTLSELQDSMMPVEVGDPELRADLADIRTLVAHLRARAEQLVRVFGR